eukprot:m.18334 g.18334  ORF g.18334 m.18334 type:complete len:350 (+) comp3328_c0_seq1:39-1088(+)
MAVDAALALEADLRRLKSQYNAMVPLRLLAWVRDGFPWAAAQARVMADIVLQPLNPAQPPSREYRRDFLKKMISMMEKADVEVADEVYSAFSEVVQPPSDETPGDGAIGHKTYALHEGVAVTLREAKEFISKGTTGLVTWQAGLAFIEDSLQDDKGAALFPNKSVLELGCGVGFLGIALQRLFPIMEYVYTDCHDSVLDALRHNLAINHMAPPQSVVTYLDWSLLAPGELDDLQPDVIVAADIVYDADLFPGLVNVLEGLLSRPGSVAYIACTVRNVATTAQFIGLLDARHIEVDMRTLSIGELFTYEPGDVVMLECCRARPTVRRQSSQESFYDLLRQLRAARDEPQE